MKLNETVNELHFEVKDLKGSFLFSRGLVVVANPFLKYKSFTYKGSNYNLASLLIQNNRRQRSSIYFSSLEALKNHEGAVLNTFFNTTLFSHLEDIYDRNTRWKFYTSK